VRRADCYRSPSSVPERAGRNGRWRSRSPTLSQQSGDRDRRHVPRSQNSGTANGVRNEQNGQNLGGGVGQIIIAKVYVSSLHIHTCNLIPRKNWLANFGVDFVGIGVGLGRAGSPDGVEGVQRCIT
jgi:hypothetical protein